MLTLLTIYFWLFLLGAALFWLSNLMQPLELVPAAWANVTPVVVVGIALFNLPMVWLQALALQSFGWPGWIAWAVMGLGLTRELFRYSKAEVVHGDLFVFPVLEFLLAWIGLTVLRGPG